MGSYAAIVMRIEDERGARAVVTQADDIIWIADELMDEATQSGQATVLGGLERDGDTLTFGTPGEGMGRLTYRIIGRDVGFGWHLAERQCGS